MKVDLHTHTKASDGEMYSEELIDKAINQGISAIAITDHDTIDGLKGAVEYSKNKKIDVVPGIELSADISKGKMHILGLYIDYEDKCFLEKIENLRKDRDNRNKEFIKVFNGLDININLEEVEKYVLGNIIAKPHFAQLLLDKGYVKNIEEAYDKFFNLEPLNKIKRKTIRPKEAIKLIKAAKGISILAHPQTLGLKEEEFEEKIKELIIYGLDGIECYHSNQTLEEMNMYIKIALKYNLLISKGSDYHGYIQTPDIELGCGRHNNILISDDDVIYNNLNKKRIL